MPLEPKHHLCKRKVKVSFIEAYNSLHQNNVIASSEAILSNTISNEDIYIEGFSREIYRSDHPSNSKIARVCLHFQNALAIKQRTDLELMQEAIVCKLNAPRNKVFCATVHRSPSQNSEQFENFIHSLEIMANLLQVERPHLIIITGDFNRRASLWWTIEAESPEGMALDEIIEGCNPCQLVDEPTGIRGTSMLC